MDLWLPAMTGGSCHSFTVSKHWLVRSASQCSMSCQFPPLDTRMSSCTCLRAQRLLICLHSSSLKPHRTINPNNPKSHDGRLWLPFAQGLLCGGANLISRRSMLCRCAERCVCQRFGLRFGAPDACLLPALYDTQFLQSLVVRVAHVTYVSDSNGSHRGCHRGQSNAGNPNLS